MEEKTSGIVLGGTNYGENDKILSIFTLEQGVVSAKIKGVKKAGAKLKFASEPFCFAEYVFASKGGMRTVTGASLIDSFYTVREDIRRFCAAGAMLEFVRKFVKEGIISSEMFVLLLNSLKSISYGKLDPGGILACFLLSALKLSGYGLGFGDCAECGSRFINRVFFDYARGAFICEKCFNGEGREINLSTFLYLKKADGGEPPDGENALKPLKLLDFYISVKAEENIKSLKELIKIWE